jgi:hypothetical protein
MGYVEGQPGVYMRASKRANEYPEVVKADWLREIEERMAKEEAVTPPKKRIRQSSKPLLNKLESEFCGEMMCLNPAIRFHAQAMRFKLGNGIWYKPDFVAFFSNCTCAYEVKGPFAHRGGFENLKVAAHQYPQIKWILVWKQDGAWKEQVVLP